MEDLNGFTFYQNYYELIKYLGDEQRLIIYDAIFKYMFEGVELDLNGLEKGIWVNLKRPLIISKNCSYKGKKGGAPLGNKNAEKKQPKNNLKTNQKQPKNKHIYMSYVLCLLSNVIKEDRGLLRGKMEEWLNYKAERGETYKDTGLKALLTKVNKEADEYGEEAVVELIEECMGNNWKGIIWEKLKDKPKRTLPTWYDKEIELKEMTVEETKELEDMLNEFE